MSLQILTFCCRNALQHYRKATFVFVEGGGGGVFYGYLRYTHFSLHNKMYVFQKITFTYNRHTKKY